MGIGDWGLGIGDWGLGIGLDKFVLKNYSAPSSPSFPHHPSPQFPVPSPQSPVPSP
ncbi:MAG: hypothetical protein ACFKPT_08515 [Gloeotrichia echinulata GP01]